jgi:hypothetical protein
MKRGTGDRESLKHAHMTKQSTGRRLMPAELAKAAAEMGLPVSPDRYRPETTESKNRRAIAYAEGRVAEVKACRPGVPKRARRRRSRTGATFFT